MAPTKDICSCSNKEMAFFEQLYTKYYRLMYKTACHYALSQHDVEDVLQDALTRLLVKIPKLMILPSYALPTYLVYTVKNTALNHNKHKAIIKSHEVPDDVLSEKLYKDTSDSISDTLEKKEYNENILHVWNALSFKERDLLYRKYVLEQQDSELAEDLHCQPDSIRMMLTRARRKARSLMNRRDLK